MFYSKSYPFKKQDLLFMSMLLFGITSILTGVPFKKDDLKVIQSHLDVALNHEAPPMATSSWNNAAFFAPSVAVTLGSFTSTFYGDSPGCTYLKFPIRVVNTSTNGEALTNINITTIVGPDITIGDLVSGDDNNNNQLDVGEFWGYQGIREITGTDIQIGDIPQQVHVEASVVGLGATVSDDSHPTDMALNEPTMAMVGECGIGLSLLLTGVTKDGFGDDGGCDSVELTYELHNTGFVGETFESVVLKDPNVGDILEPDAGNDFNISILDEGEVWIYKVPYVPTAEEWLAGQIEVQGYVEAISANQGNGILISDVSDPMDLNGNNPTIVDISACTPKISLVQSGIINNCNSIDFTYTVTNESDPNNGQGQILQGITVSDFNLPVVLDGPFNDVNNDLLMDPGEFWTYTASYPLTAADILAGEVIAQSNVAAFTDIPINMSVEDISDFEDITLNRETVIDLSGCAPFIALVKQGVVSPDCSKIDYTFTVTNEGNNGLVFENVILTDPLLGGVIAGPDSGDNGNDLLEAGEIWEYIATYNITADDINAGHVDNQAQVTADVFNFPGLSAQDLSDDNSVLEDDITSTDLISCQTPSIQLIKEGQATIDADADTCIDGILYTFTVTNTGNVDLHSVVLTDDKIGGVVPGPLPGEDDGNDGILSVGEDWIYQGTYALVIPQDTDNGFVINQADVTALSIGNDTPVADNQIIQTDLPMDLCAPAPAIQLIKTGDPSVDADANGCVDGILYTFTVTNIGNVDLHTVVLNDDKIGGIVPGPLPGEDDGNDGILSVGEDWVYQGTYALVLPDDENNGFVINNADVAALSVGDNTPVADNQQVQTNLPLPLCPPAPSIQLIKTGDPSVDLDANGCIDGILYTFTVTNTGNVDLHTVVLNDDKIGGIVPGPLPGEDDGNDGILSVGEDWVYQGTYSLVLPDDENNGFVINNADVAALSVGDNTPVTDNQQVQTNLPADLCAAAPAIELLKVGNVNIDNDNDGCLDGITYTFTVTNIGNVDLHTVVLNDDKIGGVVPGPLPGEDDNNDGILSIGEDWVYQGTYSLVLPDDENNGFVINNADVSALSVGDNTPVVDNQQVQTNLPADLCAAAPAIELLKVGNVNIDNDNDGCLDGITYTFTVTNIGNVDLQNVVLNDDKIGGVVPGPEPNEDDGNDGILSIGEDWIFQATYNLVQADIDAGFVINNADVSALSVGDNTPVADNQQVQTDLPVNLCAPAPAIAALKQGVILDDDADGCIDSIHYTFTVTNIGNVELQTIVLNDPKLGGNIAGPIANTDNGDDGILSVGESWSYEATYTLTDVDKGNGLVDNQATVTASSVGDNTPVADLSDDNSLTEDQLTTVVLPADLCAPMPGLALIKTGTLVDLNMDGCNETILYSFRVLNTGGMDLQSIVVTDPLLGGIIIGPISDTDENNDGILSTGESWNYEVLYAITQQDIDMGSVTNQATVTGVSVGDNQEVSDFSDDDSPLEDDPTNTVVPNNVCTLGGATIGLIKTGALADTDDDECPESIQYTLTVTNTGEFELTDIQLTDQQLLGGTITGPIDGTDDGNDGVLSLGETWTYCAIYSIGEQDVLNGFVTNQATVTANTIGIVASIFDLSDDDSLEENDMTITAVPDFVCNADPDSDENFEIFSGITPNGDGYNDYFRINGIQNYPDNVLKIFNRWGALVYESEGYGIGNNLFYGVSEGKATILKDKTLPSGTYFYILTFPTDNPGQASYSGYLYINRN